MASARDMDEGRGVGRWTAISWVVVLTLLAWSAMHWPRPRPFAAVIAKVLAPTGPLVQVWLSTADRRLRLAQQPGVVADEHDVSKSPSDVVIDIGHKYQTMAGFGAALTHASAWLIQNTLSASQRAALLQELFGPPPGLNFNMLRITIGASDFSLQHFTLDDMPAGEVDPELQHFNFVVDPRDVIPVLHDILTIQPGLRIIASPWSAPAWMKTSANLISGTLLEQYEAAYANYLVRSVDAFQGYGIPIFALTVQNEPEFEPLTYPGMSLSAQARARLIGQYLGPALAGRKPETVILGWDHNWDEPGQPLSVLADPDARRYIAGIAWHCYRGDPGEQTTVHNAFPHKDVYLTECSGGDWPSARKNGELLLFARNIVMMSIKNWARGAVYWNLVLDENHGPHAGGCDECKGIVTVDSATGAISRNDEYYAFAHFSRFVLPGAVRVKSGNTNAGTHEVAFQNPDGSVVLVAVNGNTQADRLSVKQGSLRFEYDMPASSVATFVWSAGTTGAPASAASSAR